MKLALFSLPQRFGKIFARDSKYYEISLNTSVTTKISST